MDWQHGNTVAGVIDLVALLFGYGVDSDRPPSGRAAEMKRPHLPHSSAHVAVGVAAVDERLVFGRHQLATQAAAVEFAGLAAHDFGRLHGVVREERTAGTTGRPPDAMNRVEMLSCTLALSRSGDRATQGPHDHVEQRVCLEQREDDAPVVHGRRSTAAQAHRGRPKR